MFKKLIAKKKLLIAIGLIVGLVIFLVIRNNTKSLKVQTYNVGRGNVVRFITASGETSVNDANTKYAQLTATIQKLNTNSGSTVKKGDLILTLDSASIKAASDASWADYLTAKASLDSNYSDIIAAKASVSAKKKTRDLAQERYNEDGTSDNKEELKIAEFNYQAAIATLNTLTNKRDSLEKGVGAAYSTFASAWQNLSNTKLTAPSDGIVAIEDIGEGEQVTVGTKLFSIVSPDSFEFLAEVDETDIRFVELGEIAEISLDSYDKDTQSGKVTLISATTKTADSGGTVVEVSVKFDNSDVVPILGLNGEVRIKTDSKDNVLAIPFEYLEEDNDGMFVFVEKDGKAQKRRVTIGLESDDLVEITEGLSEGEVVIRGEGLSDGAKVSK